MVDDIIPGVIISEMPKLRSTTCWSLSWTTTTTSSLFSFAHRALWNIGKKFVNVLLLTFFLPFLTCFFTCIGKLYRISSPSPHRGMWATFRRIGADVGGYEKRNMSFHRPHPPYHTTTTPTTTPTCAPMPYPPNCPCDSTKRQSQSHFAGVFRNYFESFLNNSWPHYPSKLISGYRFGTFWYVISDGWR